MSCLSVRRLEVRGFRNLEPTSVELADRFNVIWGDNGQGKTNLLESVYVALTSRSFRSQRPSDLIRHDEQTAFVRVTVADGQEERTQSVGLRHGGRVAKVDDKRIASLADYAVRSPVVVFHPGDMDLSMGGGAERRKLLDRIALYEQPGHMASLADYAHALRSRQKLLEVRGPSASGHELDTFEALVVEHGSAVQSGRQRAAERLIEEAVALFGRIGAPQLHLRMAYASGCPDSPASYAQALRMQRPRDARRKSAGVGPHRDDLQLELGGHGVRKSASQGQHRSLVLSLKLAEMKVIEAMRGVRPVLLLDDVSSELDAERTAALFEQLRVEEGQVLLTTTRRELFDIEPLLGGRLRTASRRDFRMDQGVLSVVGGHP